MERNVGGTEKSIRLATGVVAVVLALFGGLSRRRRIAALSFGAIELATALSGYCPVNEILGRNSHVPSLSKATEDAWEHAQQVFAE